MQTAGNPKFIGAIFIRELKNRFLCEVDLNGEPVVCYVPSSCRLSNFLNLVGKQVLLVQTQVKAARTQYSLFAVPYKRNYILLNASLANRVIESNIHSRRFSYLGRRKSVLKEHYVGDYKSDLFIEDTNTIVEIKSVLSLNANAQFPTVLSERSLKQLRMLKLLLEKGYRVHYIIVSLNPYVKSIVIPSDMLFTQKLQECIQQGMCLASYSCGLENGTLIIKHRLPIRIEESAIRETLI